MGTLRVTTLADDSGPAVSDDLWRLRLRIARPRGYDPPVPGGRFQTVPWRDRFTLRLVESLPLRILLRLPNTMIALPPLSGPGTRDLRGGGGHSREEETKSDCSGIEKKLPRHNSTS